MKNDIEILDFFQLYAFTKARVLVARRQARGGKKDEAREVARFVRNARIIEILRPIEWPDHLNVDIAHFAWQLGQLENECHPLNAATFPSDDIGKIYSLLETIAQRMEQHFRGVGVREPGTAPSGHGWPTATILTPQTISVDENVCGNKQQQTKNNDN